jgi:F-box protein 18 (helicase)
MEFTDEQSKIITSSGDIKINAVAGAGKTSTLIEYARTRPSGSKILYLAFNKSVRLEAIKRFTDNGLHNVDVETAHSLAYKQVIYQTNYRIRSQGYTTYEIVNLLKLQGGGEKHAEYVIGNHINRFVTFFCNSDKTKVSDLDYLATVNDPKSQEFVKKFYDYILHQTRIFLAKMNSGEIEIIHDFYLKKFQLSSPQLHYDYILFDEGQDASAAMLDVFFKQKATKVIVGDTHQQIYGWRYAINSLEKAEFKDYYLTSSFRFEQSIADLGRGIIEMKSIIGPSQPIKMVGCGKPSSIKSKAIIGRTNLGLLLKAIQYMTQNKQLKRIYFEGNINSYAYADEGASLYDVLNLYNGKRHLIRDNLIRMMKDIDELEEYVDNTEDQQLGMMIGVVKEYGSEVPEILKKIRDKHVEDADKYRAEMIFSTVHRCKGMEYDSVELVNDFISKDKLEKITESKKDDKPVDISKLIEEINLLYVAVTRAKSTLKIPKELIPIGFGGHSNITIVKEETPISPIKTKSTPLKAAYMPWTDELDEELMDMYYASTPIKQLMEHFGRSYGAIKARIEKLEAIDYY